MKSCPSQTKYLLNHLWQQLLWQESQSNSGSPFRDLLVIAIIVERRGVLDEFQNAMHPGLVFTIQFLELHGNTRPGMQSCHGTVGVQLAIVDRENQLEIRAGREDGAGFHITPAQADIDQIAEDRASSILWLQLDRDAALHAGIKPAVFPRRLLLLFQIHAAV